MLEPVLDLMDQCWRWRVELGLDVVLDYGFWTRKSRDDTRAKVASLGAGAASIPWPYRMRWRGQALQNATGICKGAGISIGMRLTR
jgi:predicted kinase